VLHRCGSQTPILSPRFSGAFCYQIVAEQVVYMVY
jgi:hypothetical protein